MLDFYGTLINLYVSKKFFVASIKQTIQENVNVNRDITKLAINVKNAHLIASITPQMDFVSVNQVTSLKMVNVLLIVINNFRQKIKGNAFAKMVIQEIILENAQ